jgi:hypothetical protein
MQMIRALEAWATVGMHSGDGGHDWGLDELGSR